MQRIPIEDHSPPLLVEVVRFCEDVAAWMRSDRKNVIVAHCKVTILCFQSELPRDEYRLAHCNQPQVGPSFKSVCVII